MTEPAQHAENVRIYRDWLVATIKGPEWHEGSPWPDDDEMFGTCFNDDCQGIRLMASNEVGRWRKRHDAGMTTWQGLCRPCADLLLNDGPGGTE